MVMEVRDPGVGGFGAGDRRSAEDLPELPEVRPDGRCVRGGLVFEKRHGECPAHVSVRLERGLYRLLEAEAARLGVSRGELIRRWIGKPLQRLERDARRRAQE